MEVIVISLASAMIALAALGAALWQGSLLRRQTAHAEHVSNAQFYLNITIQWIEFDKFCIDRPHLWAYFHGNKPSPGAVDDQPEFICMASAIGNLAEMCVNSKNVLGSYSGDWEKYFRFVYLRGPFFRDFWQQYRSLWSAEVSAVFLTPIAGVDPSPTSEKGTPIAEREASQSP